MSVDIKPGELHPVAYLDQQGWGTQSNYDDETGHVCAMGAIFGTYAINKVRHSHRHPSEAEIRQVRKALEEIVGPPPPNSPRMAASSISAITFLNDLRADDGDVRTALVKVYGEPL